MLDKKWNQQRQKNNLYLRKKLFLLSFFVLSLKSQLKLPWKVQLSRKSSCANILSYRIEWFNSNAVRLKLSKWRRRKKKKNKSEKKSRINRIFVLFLDEEKTKNSSIQCPFLFIYFCIKRKKLYKLQCISAHTLVEKNNNKSKRPNGIRSKYYYLVTNDQNEKKEDKWIVNLAS